MKNFELKEIINKLELFSRGAKDAKNELFYLAAISALKAILYDECEELYDGRLPEKCL